MSFQGYLLKVNGNIIPLRYMAIKTYKSTPNALLDLDSYRDGDGFMHRSILPHTVSTIEFTTPCLWLTDKIALQSLLPSRKKLTIEYWNDETNTYTSGDFYTPDVSYSVYRIKGSDIQYMPISYKLIEY